MGQLRGLAEEGALAHLPVTRLTVTWSDPKGLPKHMTLLRGARGLEESSLLRNIHPEAAQRIELSRLREFVLERLPSHEQLFVYRGQARENPEDERIFVFAEICEVPGLEGGGRPSAKEHLLEF